MKPALHTFLASFLTLGACCSLLTGGTAWADDKAAASGEKSSSASPTQAPDINTYQPAPDTVPTNSGLDPSTGSMEVPDIHRQTVDPEKLKEEEKEQQKEQNWLFNNIADQQKADRNRARAAQGLPPEKDKDTTKDDASTLSAYPVVSLTPPKPEDAVKEDKDGKPIAAANNTDKTAKTGTNDPGLPLAKSSTGPLTPGSIPKPTGDGMTQFQPLIKGLSVDTSKPISDSSATPQAGSSKSIASATTSSPFGDTKITPLNPDLIKPIDFSSNSNSPADRNADTTSPIPSGAIVIAPATPDEAKTPSFAISDAPTFNSSYNSAITAPSAASIPMPPSVTAITANTPIDAPGVPAAPAPNPMSSYRPPPASQMVPTAGSSKVKVNDPLDMTFVR